MNDGHSLRGPETLGVLRRLASYKAAPSFSP